MKVLIDSACKRVGDGIASSLFWIPDTDISVWFSEIKPVMDMFDETTPDIVIVEGGKLSSVELKIASSRYPHTRIISVGKIEDRKVNPHLSISKYNTEDTATIHFDDAAMIGKMSPFQKVSHLHTDLLCLTDQIDQNDKTNKILDFLCKNYNIKMFGDQKVDFPNYLGQIDPLTRSQAISSAVVYIDLDGGSWYDAAWFGRQCVSVSESCFRNFDNIEKLQSEIEDALKEGEKNCEGIKLLVKNKTYFELAGEILSFFGLMEQRHLLMEKKKEIKC